MIKKYQILFLIFLSYIVILSFYPSITSGFINLDDTAMVVNNQDIRSLSLDNIKRIFSSYQYGLYNPMVILSYAIEYSICKIDPYLYHVDNIILHLLNTLLVFYIIKLLSKSFFVGFFTAFVFALHPVHVEPVAWVTARKDTLFSFFFLSSLLVYIKSYEIKKGKNLYYLSIILFIFSCLSKPTAVTLPIILMLVDFYNNKLKVTTTFLRKYIPFFVIMLIFSYVAVSGHYSEQEKAITTIFVRCMNFFDAHFYCLFYIYKFFLPINLSCVYPNFYNHNTLTPAFIFFSATILYLLILFVTLSLKINKKIFFGFFFFLITLLPSSGILSTGIAPVADRYTYIPYIGLSFMVAEFLFGMYKRNKILKIIVCFALFVMGSSFVYLTYQRSILWSDNEKLITEAVNYAPDSASEAYLLRGIIYKNQGKFNLAEKDIEKSYSLNKINAYTVFRLGQLKQEQKEYLQAKKYYSCIPYTNVNYIAAINNIGIILDIEGKTQKALSFMEKKKEKASFFVPGYFFATLAQLYYKENNIYKAIENMKQAVTLNPFEETYYIQLMTIYEKNKDFVNFEKTAFEGLQNADNKTDILNKLAAYFFENERYDDVQNLLVSNFDYFDSFSYFLLGNVFALEEYYEKALMCYTMATTLNRDNGEYYFKRSAVWYLLNKYDLAKKDVEKAEKYNFVVDKDFKKNLERV